MLYEGPLPAQLFLGSRPNHRIGAVKNRPHHSKPEGGLWTSDLEADGSCAWGDYVAGGFGGRYGHGRAWKLEPEPEARIFVIDGLCDLQWLQAQYPRWPAGQEPPIFIIDGVSDLQRQMINELAEGGSPPTAGSTQMSLIYDWTPTLDWPNIAEAYDGVRLSARGFRALGEGSCSDWSVPSTVFFRWCFSGEPERCRWPVKSAPTCWQAGRVPVSA